MASGNAQRYLDAEVAELAARQHGVVATRQLEAMGCTRPAIGRRVNSGRLHRLHRGVYAVGHTAITVRGRWLAAVLAAGPSAVLSHWAAAALWELRQAPSGPLDVSALGPRRIPGVRCHAVSHLDADRTAIDAIPVTSLERTLLDLAPLLSRQRLRSVLEAAQRRDLFDRRCLEALLARSQGRRGPGILKAAVAELHDEAPWTQSELERRFLELIRAAGLPEPQANVNVAGLTVDFYWPAQRLVIEVDGYRFHRSRRSFEDDRRRDARLQIASVRVARVTQGRIIHGARELVADVRGLLGCAAA